MSVTGQRQPGARAPARTLTMIANLRLDFKRYRRFTWEETEHLKQSQQEHRDILELCRLRETDRACALLKRHILATGTLLTQRLKSRRTE